jgi:hypothetical protein
VASIQGLYRRLRGDHLAALSAEVAAMREVVLHINHVVVQMNDALLELKHDVYSGAERSLPLFLGYVDRLRLDTDTAVGAVQVIERQLAELADQVAALRQDG